MRRWLLILSFAILAVDLALAVKNHFANVRLEATLDAAIAEVQSAIGPPWGRPPMPAPCEQGMTMWPGQACSMILEIELKPPRSTEGI
jgi:hypothetical protein